jgi:hypothetical protein
MILPCNQAVPPKAASRDSKPELINEHLLNIDGLTPGVA